MGAAVPAPCGARALWRAVVRQALVDAACTPRSPEAVRDRADARAWITTAGVDFARACALADLDPDLVRRIGLEAIASSDARALHATPHLATSEIGEIA